MPPPTDRAERAPVLIGVGVVDATHTADASGPEAVDLMTAAVRAAAADTGAADGGRALLRAVERVATPKGSWSYPDPGRLVAQRVGASGAATWLYDIGIPQQAPIDDAVAAIMRGELSVAVIVGGEAKGRQLRAERAGAPAPETAQPGAAPDVRHEVVLSELLDPCELAARAVAPVAQYALLEQALRTAEGRTLTDDRADIAALWARGNAVAARNPRAAFGRPMTADEIATAGPANRPLASPYNKWHATQWAVDQAAALIVASEEAARAGGADPGRALRPLVGLHSVWGAPVSRRRAPETWPGMAALGETAAARLGRPLAAVEVVDLYSCFPVAVRLQQRALGLPLDGTPTVTGGMAFAGGPLNSYVLHATAAVAERLRAGAPGELGLVTSVSAICTKAGLAVWSNRPDGRPPHVADRSAAVEAATATVESVTGFTGAARVRAATTLFEGHEPARLLALLDTDDGRRTMAVCDDPALAADALERDLAGAPARVDGAACSL